MPTLASVLLLKMASVLLKLLMAKVVTRLSDRYMVPGRKLPVAEIGAALARTSRRASMIINPAMLRLLETSCETNTRNLRLVVWVLLFGE